MTPGDIIKDVEEKFSEHLEMFDVDYKFKIISNILAFKLAYEMVEKDHYKNCFESFFKIEKEKKS